MELLFRAGIALSKCSIGRRKVLLQEFTERAAECIRLAKRARSDQDRDLFIELARAWCGVTEAAPKTEARSRH
jgi:hypothetical protein